MHGNAEDARTARGVRLSQENGFLGDAKVLRTVAEQERAACPEGGLQDRILSGNYSGRRMVAAPGKRRMSSALAAITSWK